MSPCRQLGRLGERSRRLRRALGAAGLALMLAACGGAELLLLAIPGVGTGGTGIVAGIVTGLGSIIVDGERYDEAGATLVQQTDLGTDETLSATAFQVGQYVQMELGSGGAPARVLLDAQIVGPVALVDRTQNRLLMLGQNVVVNTDAARGPVTIFSGANSLSDIAPGDSLRIYGSLKADPGQVAQEHILASRIEHLGAQTPALVRLTGSLRAGAGSVSGGGTGWAIGTQPIDLSAARWSPASSTAEAGMVVTVVAPWVASATSGSSSSAASAPLVIQGARALISGTSTFAGAQRLSGPVRLLGNGLIEVQGVRVDASAAALSATLAALTDGSYVVLTAQRDAAGNMVAIGLDRPPGGGRPADLRGTVDSLVGSTQFRVRGVVVDASRATWVGTVAAALTNGSYVHVQGELAATGVRATRVELLASPPDNAVVQWTGTVQSVNDTARSIVVLAPTGQLQAVVLPDDSTTPRVGDTLDLVGYWQGGQLQARDFDTRPALEPGAIELKGVLELLADGRLRVAGQTLQATAEQLQALAPWRGREVRLKVRQTASGGLQLLDIIQSLAPRKP